MSPRARRIAWLGAPLVLAAWAWNAMDPRLETRLDRPTRDAVAALVDSAAREGLETEPLIDLALEGSSKRMPAGRIVYSVRSFLGDLRRARAALGPVGTPADISAAARALKAGVDLKQIERLRAARSGQRFASALNAVYMLANSGVPADTAATVFVDLVLASATEAQIAALHADIERDMAGGTPAGLAVLARGIGLQGVIAAQSTDGGAPGATLPSARGSARPADPGAVGPVPGTSAGNTTGKPPGDGSRAPAPRGKPIKRP